MCNQPPTEAIKLLPIRSLISLANTGFIPQLNEGMTSYFSHIDIASKAISKYYNQPQITGTSITYWSDECGIKVHDFSELKNEFDLFINNLENYKPQNLIMEKLTYEHIRQYLVDEFIKIKK